MKTNKEPLRSAMDRRLSFLDELPSCRAALHRRIAQEETPVMKKKLSVGLVFALVLVLLAAAALAAGLLLSPRVSAARTADLALKEQFGVTEEMQTFFSRNEAEQPDSSVIVTYTGTKEKWGVGEPSMVVVDGTLYVYYSWNETVETTRVSTAPADDPLWPAKLTHHGTAINKQGLTGADHCDVKYCDEMKKFIAIHTAQRMSKSSFIQIWISSDGKTFQKYKKLTGRLGGGLHNIGISGDAQGHIDVNKQQFIAYAYGLDEQGNSSWGRWNTKWNPLKITKK